MKTLTLALITSMLAFGDAPDLKRNQQLQKLAHQVVVAQQAKQAFVDGWSKECSAKGRALVATEINIIDCVALPAQPVMPPKVEAPK